METKDKLLKWEELSQEAKDHAIKHYREHGFSYDWWDSVYEMAKEEGAKLGFYIDDIFFSGFWSQGDGACWTGQVDVRQWLESQGIDSIGVSAWCELIQEDYTQKHIRVTHSGHYSHENTMRFADFDYELDPDPEEASTNCFEMRGSHIFYGMDWKLLLEIIKADESCPYKNPEQLQEAIEESAKDYARDIYKQLREDYEYLTSDEVIAETLEANDYNFTDEGELA